MPVKLMTVEEWIAIPDNPIQRDTERHARKAKHLRTPKPTHWICFACQYPSKKLVKLDGHTRALLWKRKEIPEPPSGHIEVHCIPVKTIEEAIDLYKTFDSKDALETLQDKVSGGFHHLNFNPESPLLQRGNITTALRICWNVWKGRGPMTIGSKKNNGGEIKRDFSVYEAIEEFSPELMGLDSYGCDHKSIPSAVVAAFILTNRKYGHMKMFNFWTGVFGNGGEKSGGRMDGVQAITEMVMQRKGRHHNAPSILDLTARCVSAAERWLNEEMMVKIPRPFDLHGYIANAQPQVRLIKPERNGKPEGTEERPSA